MIDLTPERIKKWCIIIHKDNGHHSLEIIDSPTLEDLEDIKSAMHESKSELRNIDFSDLNLDEAIGQAYIFEWAFYITALNNMVGQKSSAGKRHYSSNSYLSNFGIIGSNNNVRLGTLQFKENFLGHKVLKQGSPVYSQTSKVLRGNRDTYMDHHEILFGVFESMFMQILRDGPTSETHIVNKNRNQKNSVPIEHLLEEQQGLVEIIDRFDVRIIFSVFMLLTGYKFFLRDTENHNKLTEALNNIPTLAVVLTQTIRKKWYWVHADSSGEISLLHRGIIAIPEYGNSMFFSISRAWGIFLPDNETSNKIYHENPANFMVNEVHPISNLRNILNWGIYEGSAVIGGKINTILNANDYEVELFYPYAKKLAFHPDYRLNQ